MELTPKEKAKQLVDRYNFVYIQNYTSMFEVKQCALIAVDEILKAIPNEYLDIHGGEAYMQINEDVEYWNEVKKEINNL
jgi:hypothetical protein